MLYHYDEPLIFTVDFGPAAFLLYKIGQEQQIRRYLAVATFGAAVDALRTGRISVRGALDQDTYWIIDTDSDLNVKIAWQVPSLELPPTMLPKRGLGLFSSAGRTLPDTLQQALAFFSVKFMGEQLSNEVIRFSRFKSLIDNVYYSVKKIFPPLTVGGKSFSREVDYEIFQPKLSSLVVSIKEPFVNIQKIKRRFNVNLVETNFADHFQDSRDDFFLRVNDVVRHAERGDLKKGYASENFDTLDQISEIMPSPSGFVDVVEFRSAPEKNTIVHIEGRIGERIKEAHRVAVGDTKVITGTVIEINDESATFVIKNRLKRQITCVLSRDMYDQLSFSVGTVAKVQGDFRERKRRDKMIVKGIPEFTQPG